MPLDRRAARFLHQPPVRLRRAFPAFLAGFVLLYAAYGAKRLTLGIDFTDEGEYLSWPLRTLFGERPFASEVMTLLKPIGLFLSLPFRLHPEITLYEIRLIGWAIHLAAFAIFSTYLFVLSRAALRSLLLASVPFFVCQIFGIATPSYNSLSSDFLLIALSLWGLTGRDDSARKKLLSFASGAALFVATLAHPALGLVAAIMLARELVRNDLLQNLRRRQSTPSNRAMLTFVAAWLVFVIYLVSIGAAADWIHRLPLTRSFAASSLASQPWHFFSALASHPFSYSRIAAGFSIAALLVAIVIRFSRRSNNPVSSAPLAGWLALLLIASLITTYRFQPQFLPSNFAQLSLILIVALGTPLLALRIDSTTRFLLLMAGLAGLLCATFTYYFSPERSWLSGILALPFAFGTGLTLLLDFPAVRPALNRALVLAALVFAVVGVARDHFGFIFRDGAADSLTAEFHVPRLRHVRSTPARVEAVDALYDYLHPQIARGEALLVFDECAMLYFIFQAQPAYAWAGAKRYNLSDDALVEFDREFEAKPLPTYAIRTLVDVSNPDWEHAPRTRYDHYPLNESLLAHYHLQRTIFPFEVWQLNVPAAK